VIVRANEGPGTLDSSSVERVVPADIELAIKKRSKVVRSPVGVSVFPSGLANGPSNVEPLVAVRRGTGRSPVFFLAVIGKTGEACSIGGSGVPLLFRLRSILVCGGSPKRSTHGSSISSSRETACSLGNRYRCSGSFWFLGATKQPATKPWCRRRGRRRSGSTVCRFERSPKNPPGAGAVVVVVVDESPAGLGGPPNNPPVVVAVLSGPLKRTPDVAAGGDQHQEPKG